MEQVYLNKLSEHDALCALAFVCIIWDLPPMEDIWNKSHPDDLKDRNWTANVMFGGDGLVNISNYNLHDLSQVQVVLTALGKTQPEMVEYTKELLWLPPSEDNVASQSTVL